MGGVALREGVKYFFETFVEYVRKITYSIRSAGLDDLWVSKDDLFSFYMEVAWLFREIAEFVEDYVKAVSKFLSLFYELAFIFGVKDIRDAVFGELNCNAVDYDFLRYHVKSTVDLFLPPVNEYFLSAIRRLKVLVRAQRVLKSETLKRFKNEAYIQAAEWMKVRGELIDLYEKALNDELKVEDFIRRFQDLRKLVAESLVRLSSLNGFNGERYLTISPELVVEEVKGITEEVATLFENENRVYLAFLDALNYVIKALWNTEKRDWFVSVVQGRMDVEALIPEKVDVDKLTFAINMAMLELEQVKEAINESSLLIQSLAMVAKVLESEELKRVHEFYIQRFKLREEYWEKIYYILTLLQGETIKIKDKK